MSRYGVKPEIEVFDLAMLYNAIDYAREGLLTPPLHVQFVLGVKHALPAARDILEFEVAKLHELMPEATWVAAGIGRHQARGESLVPGDGWTLPHRARGQRPLGPRPARRLERGAGDARRRFVWRVRPRSRVAAGCAGNTGDSSPCGSLGPRRKEILRSADL